MNTTIDPMKPRLAGQGASEFGQPACTYHKVVITYAQDPSTCIKVAGGTYDEVMANLKLLSPFYAKHQKDAVSIRCDDCNRFEAVLMRNV
jgi:hypothetical protein